MTSLASIIGCITLGGMGAIILAATLKRRTALQDPNDTNAVFLDQLLGLSELSGTGLWDVTIYRQNGNAYSYQLVKGSAADALATAATTFRSAKIETVEITENGPVLLAFQRIPHNPPRPNEGKKVGSAKIRRV